MPYKKYNHQTFHVEHPFPVVFASHSEGTRYGFRHVCDFRTDPDPLADWSRVSCAYYNRTWERFCYESVLRKAIEKFPKEYREELRRQLIDGTADAEKKRCDAELAEFEKLYRQQTPGMKKALANCTIESEEDARRVTSIMKMAVAMNGGDLQ